MCRNGPPWLVRWAATTTLPTSPGIAGDVVNFETDTGTTTYVVTGTQVVNPDAIWIVDPTDTPTATLFACHPPGSVAQRIVVNLELQS